MREKDDNCLLYASSSECLWIEKQKDFITSLFDKFLSHRFTNFVYNVFAQKNKPIFFLLRFFFYESSSELQDISPISLIYL